MFREMRRNQQALSQEDCIAVLNRGTSGVLALDGDDGYPYALPISYVYDEGKLYFHCAKSGHKLDAVRRNAKASFCVIDQDSVVPEEYTSYFRSVIAFGTMRILENEGEKRAALEKLAVKYAPADSDDHRRQAIADYWAAVCMLELKVDHLTGKQARELVQKKGFATDI